MHEMAVCMGWRETKVSLTNMDQDGDKEKKSLRVLAFMLIILVSFPKCKQT